MIVYSKEVTSLESYKNIDGYSDVVFSISWSLIGQENGLTSSCPCNTYVTYVSGQPFVPYNELTQSQIEQWIDTYTPLTVMEQYQNTVKQNLFLQQQTEVKPLPWVSPS